MKHKLSILALALLLLFFVSACDDDTPPTTSIDTATALSNYWTYNTNLTAALEAREGTMSQIRQAFAALEVPGKSKDAWTQLDALVDTYVAQSEAIADQFQVLINAENAIIPYGDSKGILSSIAKGIYTKARDTVVSGGRMVRSGYRVLRGTHSLRQVLNDPNSGIPLVSSFAETVQKRNTARDALIRQAILNWNPVTSPTDYNDLIPYDTLPGSTPQEKANAYLNLSDEDPIKMQTRSGVVTWDHDENVATALTSAELGETGVKTVADAYGGGVGEWTNEVVNQHLQEGQTPADCGTLNVNVNSAENGNPPIASGRTLIISRANVPDGDPRITVIMNAPQNLEQQLPQGTYHVIAIAEGFIRGVQESLQITHDQISNVATQLLKLSENAIIIENLSVDDGSFTVGDPVTAHLSCLSTIGKSLSFSWTVTGGTYSGFTPSGTNLTFTPTEEKEYVITVTVTDSAGNTKVRSLTLTSLGGRLVIDDWEIVSENFADTKLNPGENATVRLYVSNTGTTDINGTHTVTGSGGISTNFAAANVNIAAGQTIPVNVPITIPIDYSEPEGSLIYTLSTQNQTGSSALLSDQLDFPVDFYVSIDPITELVTDRVVTISGKVANPLLQRALLVLDNDLEHSFDMNLNSGYFDQDIVLSGSLTEVQHSVRVLAVSGSLTEEATMTFNSLVPLMALRATLTWDTNDTDVDFWITDPNGEKCYYAHPNTASGLSLDTDDTDGYGPENITTQNIIPGDYLVQVHYYSDHDSDAAIGSNCQVVIRKDENSNLPPVNYYGYLGDTGDIWTVTTLTYEPTRGWSVKPNNRYSKINPATLPQK